MTVTVDSKFLPVDELGLKTVGDVLTHLQTQNRLITHVLIDGQQPNFDCVGTLRRQPLLGHTVFVETTEPRQIAIEVLEGIEQQMDQAEQMSLAVLEHLSANEPSKALQKLSGCFTIWQSAQQAIQKVAQLLRVDLDRVRVDDLSLSESLAAFATQLRAVKEAIEVRDYVLLADTLQYEIEGTVRQWRQALPQLRAVVS